MNLDALLPVFNDGFKLFSAFLCAFLITYFSIPIIVRVSMAKNLFALPNRRTSHKHATPTLGGIAMFAGVLVTSLIFVNAKETITFQYVIVGSIVLFFFGIKDDLLPLSWKKKIMGEVFAAIFLIILGNFRITDLHGILGIHQISYFSSVMVTFIVMIGIVNAINLIDGIDGLAAGLSFMATCVFGVWFYLTGHEALAIIAISVTGMLLAYLGYNVFGTTNKIFMGDTGALLLGYMMTIFVIVFNQHNIVVESVWYVNNAPVISFAILFIPLFDTLRVMSIRILNGNSPFKADRKHIHHRILRLGFTHAQTTIILLLVNGFLITIVFLMQDIEIHLLILVVLCLGIIKSLIPMYVGRLWLSRSPKDMLTFKNASKEVAKSVLHNEVRMKN